MIMSIFLMNHANMGHSRVIRSHSVEEIMIQLIRQYVCLTFKSKTVFLFQLVYESPVGVPGMNVYFYSNHYTEYYGFKMTWTTF